MARNREHRNDHEEAADQRGYADRRVEPHRVYGETTNDRTSVSRGRRKGTTNLAESMRARIAYARSAKSLDDRDPGQRKDDEREYERHWHLHLYVVRFDLLAQVHRCTADHQSGDENGQDDVDQNAVHARS